MVKEEEEEEEAGDEAMELQPFQHQVGGHTRLLQWDRATVCKPLVGREAAFYLRAPPDLRALAPGYKGLARIQADKSGRPAKLSTLSRPALDHATTSGQCFILLENVAARFRRPCVLDLKMGRRQHSDDAPADKRARQQAKCANSTSATLGVRLCGMRVFRPSVAPDVEDDDEEDDDGDARWLERDKYVGRRLDAEGFRRVMRLFFHDGAHLRSAVVRMVLRRLETLRAVIQKQESCRFYSCSLLIVYEGSVRAGEEVEEEEEEETEEEEEASEASEASEGESEASGASEEIRKERYPGAEVRLIDFANATVGEEAKAQSALHSGPDSGLLLGLDSLQRILECLLARDT